MCELQKTKPNAFFSNLRLTTTSRMPGMLKRFYFSADAVSFSLQVLLLQQQLLSYVVHLISNKNT